MAKTNNNKKKDEEQKISNQVEKSVSKTGKKKKEEESIFEPPEGNFQMMTSTGSTLLDLAISGGKIHGGGIPSGIVVEEYGPPSIGKTALLLSIASQVEKNGGETMYQEPEARLSIGFAKTFGYDIDEKKVLRPNTANDIFDNIDGWKPKNKKVVNGIFVDSLAALSSDWEMDNLKKTKAQRKKDEFARVAKLFNQGLRTHIQTIEKNNYLFVCSNQIRDVMDAPQFGEKTKPTGGWAFKFYGSLRLKAEKSSSQKSPYKIIVEKEYKGKKYKEVVGTSIVVSVDKSSVWKPFRSAPVHIIFDYGIDDIRANLQYVKDVTDANMYYVNSTKLSNSMEDSIAQVEEDGLEKELEEQVIGLWEEIDKLFQTKRKPKK